MDESPYRSPQSYETPPTYQGEKPQVVTWFMVYTICLVLLYLFVFVMGLVMVGFADQINDPEVKPEEMRIIGGIYSAVGLVFAILMGIALIVPRRKWGWIYSIVVICLGLTSCCTLPFSIALLIYWLKPETKAYFNM